MKSVSTSPLFRKGLSSNALKIVAIIAMTIDHVTWLLFPGYPIEPLPIFYTSSDESLRPL